MMGADPIALIRSFVAILLPEAPRRALAAEIEQLRGSGRGVSWVAADNLHFTLKFLGGVEPDRLERVAAALAAVAAPGAAFDLGLRGLGAFPSPSRPRVIWAGVAAGGTQMARLAAGVEEALAALGFASEGRPFSAHVTLGRVREPRRDAPLAAALTAGAGREFGQFRVDRLALMRSELSPGGARYTSLGTWLLGATSLP
jgi:RNA 2',3'-cyclic 3'-phosphodiesterase